MEESWEISSVGAAPAADALVGRPHRVEESETLGDIGTERREVEFEPLPDEPLTEPRRQSEPAPPAQVPAET